MSCAPFGGAVGGCIAEVVVELVGVVMVRNVEVRLRPTMVLLAVLLVVVFGAAGWWRSWSASAQEDSRAGMQVPRDPATTMTDVEESVYYFSSFVAIDPCRLFDTRSNPTYNIGPRNTPLGATETYDQRVWGDNGECWIPQDAVAVAMNVTIVNPTSSSYLTLFPPDASRPNASNLNWQAGQAPTPNKVDVRIADDGWVSIYNNSGTVDVLADVVGYYSWWPIADLDYRLMQVEDVLQDVERVDFQGQPTVRFSGVNVQIVDGQDQYTDGPTNGRGNLIVGWNGQLIARDRSGSHNLVVGDGHSYTAFGGIVAGKDNEISSPLASVLGGWQNSASGSLTTVLGGDHNAATHESATVCGGNYNTASGYASSVGGGTGNSATAHTAAVWGGDGNIASGLRAVVVGGWHNVGSGVTSSVTGGDENEAGNGNVVVGGDDIGCWLTGNAVCGEGTIDPVD